MHVSFHSINYDNKMCNPIHLVLRHCESFNNYYSRLATANIHNLGKKHTIIADKKRR